MPKLTARFCQLKKIVNDHRDIAYGWLEALLEIKNEQLYLEECNTWEQWCIENAGRSAGSIRSLVWRMDKKAAEKLITETTGEKIERKVFAETAVIHQPEKTNTNLSKPMGAKLIPDVPVEFNTPPPVPMPIAERARVSMEARDDLKEALRDVDRLMHDAQMPAHALKLLGDCCRRLMNVQKALTGVQQELPGLEAAPKPSKGSKPTKEECVTYATVIGLTENDGNWFFDSREQFGWKNSGRPILDWRATMRTWKAQGDIFPSHKSRLRAGGANHAPSPDGLTPERRRMNRDLQRLREGKDIA